jgi:hypothetical protein
MPRMTALRFHQGSQAGHFRGGSAPLALQDAPFRRVQQLSARRGAAAPPDHPRGVRPASFAVSDFAVEMAH